MMVRCNIQYLNSAQTKALLIFTFSTIFWPTFDAISIFTRNSYIMLKSTENYAVE